MRIGLRNRGWTRRFVRGEEGTASIEFVMWLPLFVMMMFLAGQGAVLFMVQASYGSVARDTARLVSRYALTAEEAEQRIRDGEVMGGPVRTAEVGVDQGSVVVSIATPARDIVPFDVLGLTEELWITARIVHAMEPM